MILPTADESAKMEGTALPPHLAEAERTEDRYSPLIGLPTATLSTAGYEQNGLPCAYSRAIRGAGGIPILIPLVTDSEYLVALVRRLDGLLLCGGGDVEPWRYGAEDGGLNSGTDPARDAVELALMAAFLRESRPVLGICRGAQMLNVAAGGTLVQDVGSSPGQWLDHVRPRDVAPSVPRHLVRVAGGSRVSQALGHDPRQGVQRRVLVNSSHHQAVATVAPGLLATAWAEDGVVEAIEAEGSPCFALGVQWHPEHLLHMEEMRCLFRSFVKACAQWSATHRP